MKSSKINFYQVYHISHLILFVDGVNFHKKILGHTMVVYRNWLTKRFMVWGKDPLIVKTGSRTLCGYQERICKK